MKTGKISESILKRSVLKKCTAKNPQVLQGAGTGNDCAVLDVREKGCVSCAVHPEIVEDKSMIRYAVEHALNNLACSASAPAAVLVTVLLPEGAEEGLLKTIMEEADAACREHGVQLAGGHTQVTGDVLKPLVAVSAVGICAATGNRIVSETRGRQPEYAGCEIVMTGYTGLEGTALLANMRREELCTRFPVDFVEQSRKFAKSISILKAAELAWESGAELLHDAAQGGIFGALWELCEKARCGMEADLRRLPIRQETIEICEYFGLNPYCLRSAGALLIVTKNGEEAAGKLRAEGINACVIGRLTDSNDRILINGEEKRYLERPAQDEYYRWKDMEHGKDKCCIV